MAEGFIPGLVSWLDGLLPLPVVQGESGRRLQPGTITIAPSGRNLLVRDQLRVVCEPAPEKQFHVPGIDASFASIADSVGDGAIGVLLTGMGRDGAVGLKAMRDRGATTLGQDEATSRRLRHAARRLRARRGGAPAADRRDRTRAAHPRARSVLVRIELSSEEFVEVRTLLDRTAGLVFDESRRDSLAYSVGERMRACGAAKVVRLPRPARTTQAPTRCRRCSTR